MLWSDGLRLAERPLQLVGLLPLLPRHALALVPPMLTQRMRRQIVIVKTLSPESCDLLDPLLSSSAHHQQIPSLQSRQLC